ncbi:MAG: ABC transporter ATP-binding protein [Ferruginibacter sp.]
MTTIASIRQLAKNYGFIQALKGVSLDVPQGSVFGILGPNGSGKTTMLGILTSVLHASSGEYTLFGEQPNETHRRRIGCLLETPNFYTYLNAVDNLSIVAAIRGYGFDDIDRVIDVVNLTNRKHSPFSTYSLGMKQRLAIASALLGDPDVLILDEPTNGLDPVGIAEIRSLINQLAQKGKTVIMASHLLDEVEKVCTHVAILKAGELITSGPVQAILHQDTLLEIATENIDELETVLRTYPGLLHIVRLENTIEVRLSDNVQTGSVINRFCFERGIILTHLRVKKSSLEDQFLKLTVSTK